MAEILETEVEWVKTRDKFPDRKYDEWLDGRVWFLVRGVDYNGDDLTFRNAIHQAAIRRKLRVKTKFIDVDGRHGLAVQARIPTEHDIAKSNGRTGEKPCFRVCRQVERKHLKAEIQSEAR